MSIEHLDDLHSELPELFQSRELSTVWDDDLIIVPIDDPELDAASRVEDSLAPATESDESLWRDLEVTSAAAEEQEMAVPTLSPAIIDTLGAAHAGAPISRVDLSRAPPPDCLAFYLPFHYYHPTWWGVYLLFEGVLWLANDIVRRSGGQVARIDAVHASRLFLYYHEAFHHKAECFATRLELTHRKPMYRSGFERYYQKTVGTVSCLEEALANAFALDETWKKLRNRDVDSALIEYVQSSPPGYDQGQAIRADRITRRCDFAEENQRICLPQLPSKDPVVWRAAHYMFAPIANIRNRVNYMIPRNSPLVARLSIRPLLPPNKLIKKLKDMIGLQFVRHGGSHDIYRAPNGQSIPIPRHPRDLSRGLIQGILRQAGLNMSLAEFMQR